MAEYIEREAVKKVFKDFGKPLVMAPGFAARQIDAIPAEDVALVVHGRWIEHIDHEMLTGYDECSVCHFGTIGQSNYCPNCGAKMDGGEME